MTETRRFLLATLGAVFVAVSLQAQAPSRGVPAPPREAPAKRVTLATARIILVVSQTAFVKQAEIEKAFFSRKEFEEWGLELTRDARDADVVLEVKRAAFQSNFPYSLIENRTKLVLAAGEVNSLAGTVAGRVSSQVIEKIKAARERAAVK